MTERNIIRDEAAFQRGQEYPVAREGEKTPFQKSLEDDLARMSRHQFIPPNEVIATRHEAKYQSGGNYPMVREGEKTPFQKSLEADFARIRMQDQTHRSAARMAASYQ